MSVSPEPLAIVLILVGALLVADLLLKALLDRTPVPGVVVHLGFGVVVAFLEWRWGWLGERGRGVIEFLGSIGIVLLLFRVGLDSNARKLLENLRRASIVWIGDVTVSGVLGFTAARYLLGLELVPSLFTGMALTATSVGVSVAVWREEGALDSQPGQLLVDVAELDDISGILLMAMLFAVAPVVGREPGDALLASVAWTGAEVLGRLALFGAAIVLFARFVEGPLTRLVERLEPTPDRLITVVSVGLVIAAVADGFGFSLAIGAFFAGLAFSRDSRAVRLDADFDPLYDFFTPFFFIAIGMRVVPESLGAALPLAGLLFLVAAAGKLLGAGGASLLSLRPRDAGLLGASMVPRAEIAMIIVQHGAVLGAWAVPTRLFSAMTIVSLLTCLIAPFAVRAGLRTTRGSAAPE